MGDESEARANNFLFIVNETMDEEYRGRETLDGMGRAKIQF